MLRLRLTDPHDTVPRCIPPGGIVSFHLSLTNENGSSQALTSTLPIAARAVSINGREGFPGVSIRCDSEIDLQGNCNCRLVFRVSSPSRAKLTFRVALSSPKSATLIPASERAGVGKGGGKWFPTLSNVSVAGLLTPVLVLGDEPSVSEEEFRASPDSACMLELPASLVLPGILLLERHTAITPGFGSILWDAALVLVKCMGRVLLKGGRSVGGRGPSSAQLRNVRILDVGSGTGFVGIFAACQGAMVQCTDLPILLPLLRANILLNSALITGAGGTAVAMPLVWGEVPLPPSLFDPVVGVDLITASEVAFSAELIPPLILTLRSLVECGGSRCRGVLLGARRRAGIELDDFLALLGEVFRVEEVTLGVGEGGSSEALLAQFLRNAEGLSKTRYRPQVFLLTLLAAPLASAK